MKLVSVFVIVSMLVGCVPVGNSHSRQAMRERLFNRCMELAAQMPRQSDDDVADVVRACDGTAYQQSSSVRI